MTPRRKTTAESGKQQVDTTRISQFGVTYGLLPVWGWTVEALVDALNGHNSGQFGLSGRLAEDMRAHSWIGAALRRRTQVHTTCPINFTSADEYQAMHRLTARDRRQMSSPGSLAMGGVGGRSARCRDLIQEIWPDLFPLATACDLQEIELLNGHGIWAMDWEERRDGRDRWWLPVIKPWEPSLLSYRQEYDPTSIDGGNYIATTLSHGLLHVNPGGGRWGMFSRRTLRPWQGGFVRVLGEAFCGDGYNFRDNQTHQDRWGRGIIKLRFPKSWPQQEVNACAGSVNEGGGGGVLLCPTGPDGEPLVDADILRADGAGWQTFDATEKRIVRRILITLLNQDMTITGSTGVAENDPRTKAEWECRESDILTYYDACVETIWEEIGGVLRPVPVWGPAEGPLRRQICSWIAQFNFGDAALAPYVWRDGTPPDLFQEHLDGAAKRGLMKAQSFAAIGTALKGGVSGDVEFMAEQCGLSLNRSGKEVVSEGGGDGSDGDGNKPKRGDATDKAAKPTKTAERLDRWDPPLLGTDPLDGIQVRISGVGQPFHAGHGAGVGPAGEHGRLSAAESAHKAATNAAEAKHKEEFLHAQAAKHHAEQAGHHAGASAGAGSGEGSGHSVEHHAEQAAFHATEAKSHAEAIPHHVEAHEHAATAASHAVVAKEHLVQHHTQRVEHHVEQAIEHKRAINSSKSVEEAERHAVDAAHHAEQVRHHADQVTKHASNEDDRRYAQMQARTAARNAQSARAAADQAKVEHPVNTQKRLIEHHAEQASQHEAQAHAGTIEQAEHHLAQAQSHAGQVAKAAEKIAEIGGAHHEGAAAQVALDEVHGTVGRVRAVVNGKKRAADFFGHDANLQATFSAPGHFTARGSVYNVESHGQPALKADFYLHNAAGEHVGSIQRTFAREKNGDLTVKHDYFQIDKSLQGKGAAKEVLKNSVVTYEKVGVKTIHVEAGLDKGRYVWANYGFRAPKSDVDKFRDNFVFKLRTGAIPVEGEANHLQHEIERARTTIKTMQHLADYKIDGVPVGKNYLLNSEHMPMWHGTIHMKPSDHGFRRLKAKLAEEKK